MKIILAPAKKMNEVDILFTHKQVPVFLEKTEILRKRLAQFSAKELAKLMKCNDKIASLNYERYQSMNLMENLSPAIFTYEGLAYQHLGADVMSEEELKYIETHLLILSGFYGVLRPFDGICCYRLEMQTKLQVNDSKDLYEFWNEEIANYVYKEDDLVINLASNEYSNCISPYLNENRKMITCVFACFVNGKLKTKGTEAKMCRGAMVRYMATHQIEDIHELKKFEYLGYKYNDSYSNESELVFIKFLM